MDVVRALAPFVRSLSRLARAGRSGAIRIRSGSRAATLWIAGGRLVAADGVDGALLGDTLLRRGALDTEKHGEAYRCAPPSGRVGAWLVAVGAASSRDVRAALSLQLTERVATLLRWPSPCFSFSADLLRGDDHVGVDFECALFHGLASLAASLPAVDLRALSGNDALRLTPSGIALSNAARADREPFDAAWDDAWLRPVRASLHPAAPQRAALRVLHLATQDREHAESYSLLLRKQREVRRRAAPSALLDLEACSGPDAAKHALRRLAHKLHPDRFAAAEPRLRAVSSEVLRALLHAEATLRTSRS